MASEFGERQESATTRQSHDNAEKDSQSLCFEDVLHTTKKVLAIFEKQKNHKKGRQLMPT